MPDPSGSPGGNSTRKWTPHLRARLASLRLDPAREAEIIEELAEHLDQRYEELRGGGAAEEDAHALAIAELLEPDALARYMRPLRQANVSPPIALGVPRRLLFGDLRQDLRFAVRMLRRQPGFAAAAALTLALGIGANSAIFALVDATLLRPLPLPDPDRLVVLFERSDASPRGSVAPLNLVDWNDRNRTFDRIGGFMPNVGSMVMSGADGMAETIPRQWVTAGFFDALGARAIAGRTFLPADDEQRARVVVLNEAFWRSRFNADPGIVGREIRLDGSAYTVVGVVPNEVQVFGRTSIWALIPVTGAPPSARSWYVLQAIGRLKPGTTLEAAQADMAALAEALAREFPATNAGRTVGVEPMHDVVIGGDLRQTSKLFLGVVGFVLLICCANVANLLLARATLRTRELAMRSALGADRWRVVRQLLTESLVVATLGGVLGLAAGAAILSSAPLVIPQGLLPPAVRVAFDLRVVAFCAATAFAAGVLFGFAPAWQATKLAPAQALTSDGRTMTDRGGRIRTALVAAEVATAVVLLFGAGLLLRTLLAVESVDRGYRAENVLTMIVDPLGSRYPTDEALLQFYDAVEDEVLTLPGVREVAFATTLPLGRSHAGSYAFEIAGQPPPAESQRPTADYQIVSPTYFRTVDLPLVAGRGFDARDRRDSMQVCIVNEAFVRSHLPGRSPIGARLAVRPTGDTDAAPIVREVVGVALQVKGRPDETEELVQIYVPLAQDTTGDIFMLVRPAAGRAATLGSSVRGAIGRVDKEGLVSVRSMMTLDEVAGEATGRQRFRAVLVMAFAGLALVLAMVGLFGILAYAVQQRTRDFGVRRALGATTIDLLRPVVGSAVRVVAAGLTAGIALSVALSRLLETMLYGVEPLDPMTLAAVPVVFAVTAVLAVAGPASRATRVDPATALRGE